MQAAGGFIWRIPSGWKPGGNLASVFKGKASCPFHTKLSLSPTILISTRFKFIWPSSEPSCIMITCPAVPPSIRVAFKELAAIFWIPRRGSSLNGSYVPTWTKNKFYRLILTSDTNHFQYLPNVKISSQDSVRATSITSLLDNV